MRRNFYTTVFAATSFIVLATFSTTTFAQQPQQSDTDPAIQALGQVLQETTQENLNGRTQALARAYTALRATENKLKAETARADAAEAKLKALAAAPTSEAPK